MVWRGSASVLLTIALGVPSAANALLPQVNSSRAAAGADDRARAVARMVGVIVSYSRWPNADGSVTICTMGTTRYAQRLADAGATAGRPVVTRAIAPGSSAAPQGCDVLYLGATTPALQQKAIAAIHGQPVLSINEADPACRSGTMFCVVITGDQLTFRLNVDAISRGTVRVDPRVLRLFEDGSGREAA